MRPKRRPSPATVIALVALFVALGGVGVAATGGNFILGQANTAGAKTSLSAGMSDRALAITNLNTGGSATALGLNVDPSRPPLIVNSSTKVAKLNADKLDGADAGSFMVGGGHSYRAHIESVAADGTQKELITVPSFGTLTYQCLQHPSFYWSAPFTVWELFEVNGLPPEGTAGGRGWSDLGNAVQIDILASRTDASSPNGIADIHFGGYYNYSYNTCNFEAVALVW
jgi:hypothetical protein